MAPSRSSRLAARAALALFAISTDARGPTELGDLVESVNARRPRPFGFDYALDANGHSRNIYCRSSHERCARFALANRAGRPIVDKPKPDQYAACRQ